MLADSDCDKHTLQFSLVRFHCVAREGSACVGMRAGLFSVLNCSMCLLYSDNNPQIRIRCCYCGATDMLQLLLLPSPLLPSKQQLL